MALFPGFALHNGDPVIPPQEAACYPWFGEPLRGRTHAT